MKKIQTFLSKYWSLFFLAALLIFSSYLKITEVRNNNFPFTTDQGRDMVDMRHMVVAHAPRLVGPTTSINGVLLGPFWYYFNLPAFILGGGNPAAIVYWQILWYQISVIFLWVVLRRKQNTLAVIISTLLFLMPTGFNTARYFWNANSMVFFTTFYFATLIWAFPSSTSKKLFILGLVSGLSMQIEAAFGILFFPFALLYLFFSSFRPKPALPRGRWRNLTLLVSGFAITLLPQVLFELKHQFIMTKILLGEFTGKGTMLGEKITLSERFAQRWDHLLSLIHNSSHLAPNDILTLFLVALLAFLFVSLFLKKSKPVELNIWSLSFWFVVFTGVFYLLFGQKLKIWYTLGLSIPLVIFLSSFLAYLFEHQTSILKVITILVLLFTLTNTTSSQLDYINHVALKPSDDRSNLHNELFAIDWIYQHAAGRGFKVYSYLPSVYDFPYNHLFWWYGNKKYGYEPFETTYLPNQPEYIQDVDKIWTNKKPLDTPPLTFLIIEEDMDMPSRTVAWLGNFSKLCLIKEEVFPWHAKVEMLTSCKK